MGRRKSVESGAMADDLRDLAAGLGHRRPSHEIVADAVRRRIALGGYAPGELLPTERDLARTLGIGRATLREALRQLAAEGLVSTVPGRGGGTTVLAPGRIPRGARRVDAERASALEEMVDVRAVLEPLSARRAAEHATRRDRERLVELVAEGADTLEAYTTLDTRFHVSVAAATGNRLLLELVERAREDFFAWANDLWFHTDLRERPDVREELSRSLAEHRPIAAAIAGGDPEEAERLMRAHVRHGAEGYRAIFERAQGAR
jgi:GntR family transcriptional regulator, transcriptional repressor for pyruvate dehydrogenase complex